MIHPLGSIVLVMPRALALKFLPASDKRFYKFA